MADTKLTAMTAMDSADLGSESGTNQNSVYFLMMLEDKTPVAVQGSVLRQRIGMETGPLIRKVDDQGVGTGGTKAVVSLQSVYNDPDGWWDSASKNVFRVPNDDYDQIQVMWSWYFNGGGAGKRSFWLEYTDVTSNKYGSRYPLLGVGSTQLQNGVMYEHKLWDTEWDFGTLLTNPIYVESGDQMLIRVANTASSTRSLYDGALSIQYLRRRT